MKKKLKKLMVLTLVAAIFIMPASTALAASDPVVVYDSDEATFIDYLPDPLHVAGGGYHPVLLKEFGMFLLENLLILLFGHKSQIQLLE